MPPKKTTKKVAKVAAQQPNFFILRNIDPIKLIYEHLLLNPHNKTKNILQDEVEGYVDHLIPDVISITTNLSDILKESSINYTIFNDIRKNQIKGWPTLVDYSHKEFDYNKLTKIKCWWCKNSFDNYPLGIPLKLKNKQLEVEGVVCSFCCGKSYIIDISTKTFGNRYKDSLSLLNYLFGLSSAKRISEIPKESQRFQKEPGKTKGFAAFGESESKPLENEEIPHAPHWTLLQDFGGHLTINEFRASFGKIKYIPTSNILQINQSILYCERILNSSP